MVSKQLSLIIPTKETGVCPVIESFLDSIPKDLYSWIEIIVLIEYSGSFVKDATIMSDATKICTDRHVDLKAEFVNFKSPWKSRREGFKWSRGKFILFNDADDLFTEDFGAWLTEEFSDLKSDKIYTFGWTMGLESQVHKYWNPNTTLKGCLKVPVMPAKIYPRHILKDIFAGLRAPDTISGEEIDFMVRLVSRYYNAICPIDVPITDTTLHPISDMTNETTKSYTERDRLINTLFHHSKKLLAARDSADENAVYAYAKAMCDICNSYVKYSGDKDFIRIEHTSDDGVVHIQ